MWLPPMALYKPGGPSHIPHCHFLHCGQGMPKKACPEGIHLYCWSQVIRLKSFYALVHVQTFPAVGNSCIWCCVQLRCKHTLASSLHCVRSLESQTQAWCSVKDLPTYGALSCLVCTLKKAAVVLFKYTSTSLVVNVASALICKVVSCRVYYTYVCDWHSAPT